MDCRVVVEAAVPVYDVETPDAAVRIAIAKTGDLLNPDLSYVEINAAARPCPQCKTDHEPAFIAADQALVSLELQMDVFNVEHEEHARRIALKEIGQRLVKIPLSIKEVTSITDDKNNDESDEPSDPSPMNDISGEDDVDILPDFEDLFE